MSILQGPNQGLLFKLEGYLHTKVNNITVTSFDLITVANLKYKGVKMGYPNITPSITYNRQVVLNSMLRPELQSQNLRNVESLNVNDKLLHYAYVHILTPRSTNFGYY